MTSTDESTPSIYREYFNITNEYVSKYGANTVLLMQVGAFFEVYGIKANDGQYSRSCIQDFAQVCSLSISEKKIMFEGGSVAMAGFRDYTIDKYIQRLTAEGYTAVVYVQETRGKTIHRVLESVYSPGTYVSRETEASTHITNHILCVWMELFLPRLQKSAANPSGAVARESLVYGVAVANIFTGKTSMFEHQTPFFMTPSTFDELERYISVYSPSEIIVVSPFEKPHIDRILQFSGVKHTTIHCVDSRNGDNQRVQNCTKQKYVRHLFGTFFGEESYDTCPEIQTYSVATQAFCLLMNFIQEHNPNLVRNMELPTFNNTSYRMVLANHTLKQLNIIESGEDTGNSGVYSSVSKFLNKCTTAIGRRHFYSQLTNPIFDTAWLNREYSMISCMLTPEYYAMVDPFRRILRTVCDVEKVMRQMVVGKVYPATLHKLWLSIRAVQQINTCLFEHRELSAYLALSLSGEGYSAIETITNHLQTSIEGYLAIDACEGVQGYDVMFIRPGISAILDDTIQKQISNQELFREIRESLNAMVRIEENNADLDYVRVHETDKSGSTLQITKKRGLVLKKHLAKTPDVELILSKTEKKVAYKDIRLVSASSSCDEIEFPLLTTVCRDLLVSKQRLSDLVEKVYADFLREFEKDCYRDLERLSTYISRLDVLITKTHLAKTYNYCSPEIVAEKEATAEDPRDTTTPSFVRAVGLRHCLIEHIQQNELYVANDVDLGRMGESELDPKGQKCPSGPPGPKGPIIPRGILLYGTNAVGKTSLIRALGIAVIMAQAGMFVPCSRFQYRPYTAIFSRILGNDNLFRGLSTFAVEMSELQTILKMSDVNSLVLGDELCSGTETESALSIFMAGLCDLDAKGASFIFATHFHEILKMDEMAGLAKSVATKHMAVHYDRELDCLVYDRKLADGPGNRMYGLEVCKSLHLPADFLERAYEIRSKYFPETKGELAHPISAQYNARKIRGLCEMCHIEIGEETHHLQEQHLANDGGYIGGFHKNHTANLMSLCGKCHDQVHSQVYDNPIPSTVNTIDKIEPLLPDSRKSEQTVVRKVVRKKTTKGYSVFVESELKPGKKGV